MFSAAHHHQDADQLLHDHLVAGLSDHAQLAELHDHSGEDDVGHKQFPAHRHTALHPCRQDHEHGGDHVEDLHLLHGVRRPLQGGVGLCQCDREYHLRGDNGFQCRRCGGAGGGGDKGDEG